jgi:streptogramin lyase
MLEKDIEAHLVRRVRDAGGVAYKFTSPAHRGVADRLVVLPGGRIWFVEVKKLGGRLSPLQRVFLDEIKKLGCNYQIVWSKEDVDAFVASLSE